MMAASSYAKALARETIEMERHAAARPQRIRRLPPLRGERAQSVLELRFQSVENLIQAMDTVVGRSSRPRRR